MILLDVQCFYYVKWCAFVIILETLFFKAGVVRHKAKSVRESVVVPALNYSAALVFFQKNCKRAGTSNRYTRVRNLKALNIDVLFWVTIAAEERDAWKTTLKCQTPWGESTWKNKIAEKS